MKKEDMEKVMSKLIITIFTKVGKWYKNIVLHQEYYLDFILAGPSVQHLDSFFGGL